MNKKIENQTKALVAETKFFCIKKQEDLDRAGAFLRQVKTLAKELKEKKEAVTKPMRVALEEARALFKPAEENLKLAETKVKQAMLLYDQEQARKAAEIVKKAQEGKIKFDTALKKMESTEVAAPQGVQFRTVRDIEIVDEQKVPKKYWVIDYTQVKKDALAGVEIPGVKVMEKKVLAASAL